MECNKVNKRLSEYLDNELGSEDRIEIERHLAACAECAADFAALKKTVALLQVLPIKPMPADASARLQQKLGIEKNTKPRRIQWPRWLLTPAVPLSAVVVLIIAGVLFLQTATGPLMSSAPQRSVSPEILAEITPSNNQIQSSAREAQTLDNSPAAKKTKPGMNALPDRDEQGNKSLPLFKISDHNYNRQEIIQLAAMVPVPAKSKNRDDKQLERMIRAAGKHDRELRRILKIVQDLRPESTPLYAESARYRDQRAWIIVIQIPLGKKVLVIKK